MLDNLNSLGGRDEAGRKRPARSSDNAPPVADREVPLGQSTASAALHQWLDGEIAEAAVPHTHDVERHVDLWKRINAETAHRREMKTPAHVMDAIMEALPERAPAVESHWLRKPLALTPLAVAAAAAGLLAIGAAFGAARRGR
jgi:hypothetical protein